MSAVGACERASVHGHDTPQAVDRCDLAPVVAVAAHDRAPGDRPPGPGATRQPAHGIAGELAATIDEQPLRGPDEHAHAPTLNPSTTAVQCAGSARYGALKLIRSTRSP